MRPTLIFLAAIAFLCAASAAGAEQPNVVLVLSDDQRVDDIRFMPKTRKLLADRGTTFSNMVAPFPLCCPARTSILTGQYAHNHGVQGNFPPEGYADLSPEEQKNMLPVWLQRAGYQTGHVGKYLNGYGSLDHTEVPPGWSSWHGTIDQTSYDMFNYWINDNGQISRYGDQEWNEAVMKFSRLVAEETFATYGELQSYLLSNIVVPFGGPEGTFGTESRRYHQVDVLAQRARSFIQRASRGKKPFFLQFAPPAPHREDLAENAGYYGINPRPPSRYEERAKLLRFRNSPSFDEADISDKPGALGQFLSLSQQKIGPLSALQAIDNYRRGRAGNLWALDDAVAGIVRSLRKSGQLQDTIIIFHSDNGWILGEHRIPGDKYLAYEESIRVPTIIRGPGWLAGRKVSALAANVDLTRTILRSAGARPGRIQDGLDLRHVKRSAVPLEAGRPLFVKPGFPYVWDQPYFGVRTKRYKYIAWSTGAEELYDLQQDPYEMDNLAKRLPELSSHLRGLAERLRDCRGQECVV